MRAGLRVLSVLVVFYAAAVSSVLTQSPIGREVAIARHLQDGEEFSLPLRDLLAHGLHLFTAVWTIEEGGGRPLSKGCPIALALGRPNAMMPRKNLHLLISGLKIKPKFGAGSFEYAFSFNRKRFFM